MSKLRILILDAGNQNALGITRRLGKTGKYELHHVGFNKLALSFFSKYSKKKYVLSKPSDGERYYKDLIELLKKEKYDILFPVGNYSFEICAKYYSSFSALTKLLVPPASCFDIAASKVKTYELAASCGLTVPFGYAFHSLKELLNSEIKFPVVVKAPVEMGTNVVTYAYNKTELENQFQAMCNQYGFGDGNWPIVQQYIEGDGYGFFAFYSKGKCQSSFMHRRIREYPVRGGASTCAVSFYDEALKLLGTKLLDTLGWNGVAMVEFKKSIHDNQYYLMEINPKFWGSLELAIASGVNFPEMVIDALTGKDEYDYSKKPVPVRFQWLLNGELFHFFERPYRFFSIVRDIFRSKTDFRVLDPIPNLIQVLMIFRYFKKKITGR
jgi:predicted ATP-grasp superfamily ATP-dependent carboligase